MDQNVSVHLINVVTAARKMDVVRSNARVSLDALLLYISHFQIHKSYVASPTTDIFIRFSMCK